MKFHKRERNEGYFMTKKRKSGGRSGGNRGSPGLVQCTNCGRMVPKDKAKKVTTYHSLVDFQMQKELRAQGAYIPRQQVMKYYCISCAVHRHVVTVRSKDQRKTRGPY